MTVELLVLLDVHGGVQVGVAPVTPASSFVKPCGYIKSYLIFNHAIFSKFVLKKQRRLLYVKKWAIPGLFFLLFSPFQISIQLAINKYFLLMTGFESQSFGVGCNGSTN